MQIPKEQIMEMIRGRGDEEQARQAEQELPGQVDTDRDQGLLSRFGITPQEILGKMGGTIPGL